jgi:hypothetical protein
VRVERVVVKLALLIAFRYKLSRPIKDQEVSTAFNNEKLDVAVTRVTLTYQEYFRSTDVRYMSSLCLILSFTCLGLRLIFLMYRYSSLHSYRSNSSLDM